MSEADSLELQLLRAQNGDGGWGYRNGSSWTEPTAFALLALEARRTRTEACLRARAWLRTRQHADGAWAPNPAVDAGTWVTSLALLAISGTEEGTPELLRAAQWTASQINANTTLMERIVRRIDGISSSENTAGGSPWFPGTASWIAPTVMTVLALAASAAANHDVHLKNCVQDAKEYILSRRCADGGWNHGGTSYRSQNASSYPEMTGMALLALGGVSETALQSSLNIAEGYLANPGSIEGLSWLQLGLMRHGRDRLSLETQLPCWTTRDMSLRLLALAADSSSNKLLLPVC